MSSRPALLFISPWPSFWEGGRGIGCSDEDEVHRGLTAAGWDVHYVLPGARGVEPPGPPGRFHREAHVTPWGEALPSGLRRPLRLFAYETLYSRAALRVALAVRPRVVIGHSYYAARPAVRVARALHVPSVAKFHGVMSLGNVDEPLWLHRIRNWETIRALRCGADRVVVLDDGTRGDRAALRFGVRPERLCFWPNGLEKDFRDRIPPRPRESVRAAAGVLPGELAVVSLSRLVPNKRVDLALAALAALPHDVKWRYLLVGDGPLRAGLEAEAARLGIADRVAFLGARGHDEVFELLKAGDVFLSTSELTNRSLSTLEAMMCGLPVVATSTGATADVVRDGVEGLLAPMEAGPLAAALGRALSDAALRARMGAAAYAASEAFPGWPERVRLEVELYRELSGGAA